MSFELVVDLRSHLAYFLLKRSYIFTSKRDIASKGRHSSGGSFQPGEQRAREAGQKGGKATGQEYPEE
ncbi:hypothetical protein BJX76DRAFT_359390 [Aspergillus varians]